MTIEEVEKFFGTMYKVCKALNITPQNVTRWRRQGYISMVQQYRIAMLTEGELMPDDVDKRRCTKANKKDTA